MTERLVEALRPLVEPLSAPLREGRFGGRLSRGQPRLTVRWSNPR